MKRIAIAVIGAALSCGCAVQKSGLWSDLTTTVGIEVETPNQESASAKVRIGLVRHDMTVLNSNAVVNATLLKATDAEDTGLFRPARVHTTIAVGKDAVTQPSAGQQMPSSFGTNTSWQPAQTAK